MASCESVGLGQVCVPYVFRKRTSSAPVLNLMSPIPPNSRDVSSHLTHCWLPSMSTTKCDFWKAAVLFLRQVSVMCKGKCQVLHTGRSKPMQHYRLAEADQTQSTLAGKDLLNKLNVSQHLWPSCMDKVQQYTEQYHSSVANRLKQVIIPLFLALLWPPFKSCTHFWALSTRLTNWMKSSGGSATWLRGLSI